MSDSLLPQQKAPRLIVVTALTAMRAATFSSSLGQPSSGPRTAP